MEPHYLYILEVLADNLSASKVKLKGSEDIEEVAKLPQMAKLKVLLIT